ncbi:MAG TPA: tetratricopeptide repeat protein [Blastocatellia bacterium]|nr:tetratricopeptide repeat protein [Blastocatellia bacterium]
MNVEFTLDKLAPKAAIVLLATCVCGLLALAVISTFIIGTLTDERSEVSTKTLQVAADHFENSARLHSRLGAIMERQGDLSDAEYHLLRATANAPYNYNLQLMLASIEESRGDRLLAEKALRTALTLAPNKAEVHWNLANLLLRRGELDNSLEAFRSAAALKEKLLPATLSLIWRVSNGSLEALEHVTGDQLEARITLARFFLNHSQVAKAAEVFNTIDPKSRLASAECAAMLDDLVEDNQIQLARSLWLGTIAPASADHQSIWNGGFETDVVKGFAQFDWIISRSGYAKVALTKDSARTGARSLRIDFAGRDTTRLDNQIRQLVVVNPGRHYRVECYARAEGLVSSEGPRIVVTTDRASEWLASSEAVATGSTDWQRLATEFTAPNSIDGRAVALLISIKRKPKFSYDEPTRGRVYFDDFALSEQVTLAGGSPQSRPTK